MRELLESPGFLAFVGTVFGASGLKLVEHWLGRAKEKALEARTARDELRKEIDALRAQLEKADEDERAIRAEVDAWREKYYNLRDEKQKVVTDLTITVDKLRSLETALERERDK